MIFSRLRRAKIVHCIRKYLNDNFHFSGNHHSKNRTDTPFKLFHSPAFAPPAELKQASKMLGWEIPSPLEENPTHTYGTETRIQEEINHLCVSMAEEDEAALWLRVLPSPHLFQ